MKLNEDRHPKNNFKLSKFRLRSNLNLNSKISDMYLLPGAWFVLISSLTMMFWFAFTDTNFATQSTQQNSNYLHHLDTLRQSDR